MTRRSATATNAAAALSDTISISASPSPAVSVRSSSRSSNASSLRPERLVKTELGNCVDLAIDEDDDVESLPDFSDTESRDEYVPVSSESSSDDEADEVRSRSSNRSCRSQNTPQKTKLLTTRTASESQSPQFPLPIQLSPPPARARPFGSSATPSAAASMSLRKRSMSIFAEPLNVDDDELDADEDAADTAAEEAAATDGTAWSIDENRLLLQTIERQLPREDNLSYTRRLKSLDWSCILMAGRTERECKEQLMLLLKKLRHVRTLGEIFGDAHRALDNPVTPQTASAYALFCADYRKKNAVTGKGSFAEWGAAFRSLSDEERKVWEELAAKGKVKDEPKRLLRDLESQKATPFNLYCRAVLEQGAARTKVQLRADYAKLSDEEKMVYIRQAVAKAQEAGVESFTVLSTKEVRLMKNKPKTLSGYNLYVRDFYADRGNANLTMVDISRMYKELSEEERQVYKDRAAAQKGDVTVVPAAAAKTTKVKAEPKKPVFLAALTPKPAKQPKQPKVQLTPTKVNRTASPADDRSLLTPLKTVPSRSFDEMDSFLQSPDSFTRKRKLANGDQTDVLATPTANSTRMPTSIKMESSSETESKSAKKKKKKRDDDSLQRAAEPLPEPQRAPTTVYEYFVERVYDGKPKKAKKAFEKLETSELTKLKREAKECMREYMEKLEKFLGSLSKTEMVEYANRQKQVAGVEKDDDFLSSTE